MPLGMHTCSGALWLRLSRSNALNGQLFFEKSDGVVPSLPGRGFIVAVRLHLVAKSNARAGILTYFYGLSRFLCDFRDLCEFFGRRGIVRISRMVEEAGNTCS